MVSGVWSAFYGGLRKGSISSSLLMARFIVTSDSVNAQLPLKNKTPSFGSRSSFVHPFTHTASLQWAPSTEEGSAVKHLFFDAMSLTGDRCVDQLPSVRRAR